MKTPWPGQVLAAVAVAATLAAASTAPSRAITVPQPSPAPVTRHATSAAPAYATAGHIDTGDRAQVVKAYRTWLEPLLSVPTGWTGSIKGCRAGTVSTRNREATLAAVNYMRAMAGLGSVALDPWKSRRAQASALIQAANGYLSHYPPKSGRCWSQKGYDGASHGNIYLSWGSSTPALAVSTGPRAVVGYMVESGDNNLAVGHRRWLMFQQLETIGTGDTLASNTIYVVPTTYVGQRGTRWVPWPTAGYFPSELEPKGRWSLSYPNADFGGAKVRITTPSGAVRVRQHPVEGSRGDNTIAWDMTLPAAASSAGSAAYPVTVRVSGIRVGGRTVTHEWTTRLIRASQGLVISPATVPPATQWEEYAVTFTVPDPVGSIDWSHTGDLPPGLSLWWDGQLRGWPSRPGTYTFTVTAADSMGRTGSRKVTIRVT